MAATFALIISLWPVDYPLEETWVQDHLLLARSANSLGQQSLALSEADAALALAPGLQAARSTRCVVAFNAWLAQTSAAAWEADCEASAEASQGARLLAAYAAWRRGERELARSRWRELSARAGPFQANALAALWWNGELDATEQATVTRLLGAQEGKVLRVTAAARGDAPAARALVLELGEARAGEETRAVQRLWQVSGATGSPEAPASR